jgi:hypothetical protein
VEVILIKIFGSKGDSCAGELSFTDSHTKKLLSKIYKNNSFDFSGT